MHTLNQDQKVPGACVEGQDTSSKKSRPIFLIFAFVLLIGTLVTYSNHFRNVRPHLEPSRRAGLRSPNIDALELFHSEKYGNFFRRRGYQNPSQISRSRHLFRLNFIFPDQSPDSVLPIACDRCQCRCGVSGLSCQFCYLARFYFC